MGNRSVNPRPLREVDHRDEQWPCSDRWGHRDLTALARAGRDAAKPEPAPHVEGKPWQAIRSPSL